MTPATLWNSPTREMTTSAPIRKGIQRLEPLTFWTQWHSSRGQKDSNKRGYCYFSLKLSRQQNVESGDLHCLVISSPFSTMKMGTGHWQHEDSLCQLKIAKAAGRRLPSPPLPSNSLMTQVISSPLARIWKRQCFAFIFCSLGSHLDIGENRF